MTQRARLVVLLVLTFSVALGPFTVSTIYVHTHHQTTGSGAGGSEQP